MVSKVVGNLRLVVGAVALFCAQTASAGLMLTINTLQDFQFNEMKVEYNPDYHSLDVSGGNEFSLSSDGSSGVAPTPVGDLYLTAEKADDGSLSGTFRVFGKLAPDDTPSDLLKGSLDHIQIDHGEGNFVFLTRGNTVNAAFANQYLDNGVQVSFRVTKLGGTGLIDAFGAPNVVGVLDRSGPQNATPSIPVPGTIALFLIAGLPLAAVRRR